jgi:hypothetical protein
MAKNKRELSVTTKDFAQFVQMIDPTTFSKAPYFYDGISDTKDSIV